MTDRPTPETDAAEMPIDRIDTVASRPSCVVISDVARRLERERDEAREALKHIEEYGTGEINAAVDLRQKLASALVERDEAREAAEKAKAFKRVLKDDNAKLRSEIDELNKRLIEVSRMGVDLLIEREDLRKELDEAREELAAERALADRLADSLTACERWVNQSCDVKTAANKALMEWKEARK